MGTRPPLPPALLGNDYRAMRRKSLLWIRVDSGGNDPTSLTLSQLLCRTLHPSTIVMILNNGTTVPSAICHCGVGGLQCDVPECWKTERDCFWISCAHDPAQGDGICLAVQRPFGVRADLWAGGSPARLHVCACLFSLPCISWTFVEGSVFACFLLPLIHVRVLPTGID